MAHWNGGPSILRPPAGAVSLRYRGVFELRPIGKKRQANRNVRPLGESFHSFRSLPPKNLPEEKLGVGGPSCPVDGWGLFIAGLNRRGPRFRRWSNVNFVFRLSLNLYRLFSSSVEAGRIPERSEAGPKRAIFTASPKFTQWNRSRTGNCDKSRPGRSPGGSCYCCPASVNRRTQGPLDPVN
jgi:hypothetical protein